MAKNKNINKKSSKSSVEEFDIRNFIIVSLIIIIVILVVYLLTVLAQKAGWFDQGYYKPEVPEAEISYEKIQSGTIFTRGDADYYVLLAPWDEEEDNIYVTGVGDIYKTKDNHLPIYYVDLSDGLNKSIIGDTSTPYAQSSEELKVTGHTLIRITNGRNVKFVEGDENIKTELGI